MGESAMGPESMDWDENEAAWDVADDEACDEEWGDEDEEDDEDED